MKQRIPAAADGESTLSGGVRIYTRPQSFRPRSLADTLDFLGKKYSAGKIPMGSFWMTAIGTIYPDGVKRNILCIIGDDLVGGELLAIRFLATSLQAKTARGD